MTAAGDVIVVWVYHGPKCLVPVPVNTIRTHGHSGFGAIGSQRLVLIGMENQIIDAQGKGPVGLILQVLRVVFIAALVWGGKSFGPDNRTACRVGNGDRFYTAVYRIGYWNSTGHGCGHDPG